VRERDPSWGRSILVRIAYFDEAGTVGETQEPNLVVEGVLRLIFTAGLVGLAATRWLG
jgi:hypothetical protein